MTRDFMSWFVGFWEGEGTFSMWKEKTYWNVELSVAQTGERGRTACEFVGRHLGFGRVSVEKHSNSRYRDTWRWKTGARREIIDLVEQMLPYMVFKTEEVTEKLTQLRVIDAEGYGHRAFGGWTRSDYSILKREYSIGVPVIEIQAHLKHRHSIKGLYAHAYSHGICRGV